jgi:Chlorophyll A-B binding protein
MSTDKPISPPSENAVESETLPAFGWTAYAEQTNGRFAMVGFIALLLLELVTRQDFFTWIGWR